MLLSDQPKLTKCLHDKLLVAFPCAGMVCTGLSLALTSPTGPYWKGINKMVSTNGVAIFIGNAKLTPPLMLILSQYLAKASGSFEYLVTYWNVFSLAF